MNEIEARITLEQAESAFNVANEKLTARIALQRKIQGQISELENKLSHKTEVDILHLLEQSEGEFTDEIESLVTQESQSAIEYKIKELRRLEEQLELDIFYKKIERAECVKPYQATYVQIVEPIMLDEQKQIKTMVEEQVIPLIYRLEALRKMCYPHMQHNSTPSRYWEANFPTLSLEDDLIHLIMSAFKKNDLPPVEASTLPDGFPGHFPSLMASAVRTAPTPAELHKVNIEHPKNVSSSQDAWAQERSNIIQKHQDK